jgi:hypothetical protein
MCSHAKKAEVDGMYSHAKKGSRSEWNVLMPSKEVEVDGITGTLSEHLFSPDLFLRLVSHSILLTD